uniref:Ankyrin repeat domain-containing protein n=1 Tax=Pyramimonas obovata TaxID=1411642 RepID=A0A7S0N614_9CHLO|mmetsp:Transcript_21513/g.47192  ORF Transcript_21513/g.47192 Transcript_21513/m.47192 type:complete len:336 (+) Transcript_21513:87-1094(+)|eukprot:CAMPEP_0118922778 /NCGR_PEP_ID=MMETSP1169-20130426/1586_1 /TAXON_ID=36882 /ORGANISM="Pyramimonas obovata, Strain CCMP722" /LENGTH=335 /DNA_ID=CAMNT_0006863701 /DNA_START=75 /DNA_END=1082 /DNA_ORIENTATION=+
MGSDKKGKEKVTGDKDGVVAAETEAGVAEVSDFILAARDGDVEAVGKGMKEDPPPSEEHLAVALWAAACNGNEAVAKLLVDAGADLEYIDDTEFTALLWAVESSEPEIVGLLIEAGADVNAITGTGATALIMASDLSNPTADLKIIQTLIKAGADVNKADSQGATALAFAAEAGNLQAVNLLMDAGAEVTTADEDGQTPLLRVSEFGAPADSAKADAALVAQRLLEKGADVNATDLEGDTAAILAARAGNQGLLDVLVAAKAELGVANKAGSDVAAELRKALSKSEDVSMRKRLQGMMKLCGIQEEDTARAVGQKAAPIGANLANRRSKRLKNKA